MCSDFSFKTFPHQEDFFPTKSVTKSSTDKNLVEKFKIFVQDFVPIKTALSQVFFFREQEQLQKHAALHKNPYCVYGTLKKEYVSRSG